MLSIHSSKRNCLKIGIEVISLIDIIYHLYSKSAGAWKTVFYQPGNDCKVSNYQMYTGIQPCWSAVKMGRKRLTTSIHAWDIGLPIHSFLRVCLYSQVYRNVCLYRRHCCTEQNCLKTCYLMTLITNCCN